MVNISSPVRCADRMTIHLRCARAHEFNALRALMFDAIQHSNSPYSAAQRRAWCPGPEADDAWRRRLAAQYVVVAERETPAHVSPADDVSAQAETSLLGFMSLASGAYLDFAYIRPGAQGAGLFRRLYAAIEAEALRQDCEHIWVHASLMAQPRFTAMGFSIRSEEEIAVRSEVLRRFVMEKSLRPA